MNKYAIGTLVAALMAVCAAPAVKAQESKPSERPSVFDAAKPANPSEGNAGPAIPWPVPATPAPESVPNSAAVGTSGSNRPHQALHHSGTTAYATPNTNPCTFYSQWEVIRHTAVNLGNAQLVSLVLRARRQMCQGGDAHMGSYLLTHASWQMEEAASQEDDLALSAAQAVIEIEAIKKANQTRLFDKFSEELKTLRK